MLCASSSHERLSPDRRSAPAPVPAPRTAAAGVRRPVASEARGVDHGPAGDASRRGRVGDLLERRDVLPVHPVDSWGGRLRAAIVLAGDERPPSRAPRHDRRGATGVRGAGDRRHALVSVLAPGQEVGAARADLGARRGRVARGRRCRSRADDGSARGPDPGLLPRPGRPHDCAPALRGPLQGVTRRRRARRKRVSGPRPGQAGSPLRSDVGLGVRGRHEDASGARGFRGSRGDRRRPGQARTRRRRHGRDGRYAHRRGGGTSTGRRHRGQSLRDAPAVHAGRRVGGRSSRRRARRHRHRRRRTETDAAATVLSVADLLAATIANVHSDRSVSELFGGLNELF